MNDLKVYHYEIVVEHDEADGRAVAFVNDRNGPLRAEAETPVLALAELAKVLARWPNGGSREWLRTLPGRTFWEECKVMLGMGDRGRA